jgi:hypothetical protein
MDSQTYVHLRSDEQSEHGGREKSARGSLSGVISEADGKNDCLINNAKKELVSTRTRREEVATRIHQPCYQC